MEEINGFHHPENRFSLAGISFFFKNWNFNSRKKSLNKKILCEVDRKPVSTENLFKNTFVID